MPIRKIPLRQQLLRLEHDVLKAIAGDADLNSAMSLLCERVEDIAPEVICSLLAVDDEGALHPIAGPSLPDAYSRALDGVLIGPDVGSCGTAAYLREPVEVRDIATDPLWRNFKALALPIGLRACWSSPIMAKNGRVIGTFAFYYRTTRGAKSIDRQIVDVCVHLCAIAIEHDGARARIERIAYLDAVTGLPNRVAFQRRAVTMTEEAKKKDCNLTLHYIDLDDFKGVNDTLGHRVGDLLLRAIGQRVAAAVSDSGAIARIGGDEFSVLQACSVPAESERLARRILAALDEPFVVEDHVIPVGASIGIAVMPAEGADLSELMKNADLALYRAKGDGRGTFRSFVPEMSQAVRTRRDRERDLRAAVEASDFEIAYQPIVAIASGRITSCEALLRWPHPTFGTIMPGEFIALAEQVGLISRIGDWVLAEACRQAVNWPADISVSINLSPVQLRAPHFVRGVDAMLAKTGLAPQRLNLEITESTFLADNHSSQSTLRLLREMGIGLALDDFGTGYSSLRSLRTFPIDRIKIDQSFVHELGNTAHANSIIRTVVALARDLGMITLAEGVEKAEQLQHLADEGCTEAQGYFIARPMSATDIAAKLADTGETLKSGRRKIAG